MGRLTKKLKEPAKTKYLHYDYMRIGDYDIDNGNYGRISDDMVYNKLGKFEDIEELVELLSDAYDDRLPIYSSEGNGKIICVKDWHIAWIEDLRWLAVEYKKNRKFNGIHAIEGYGRTFALTKEELEKK